EVHARGEARSPTLAVGLEGRREGRRLGEAREEPDRRGLRKLASALPAAEEERDAGSGAGRELAVDADDEPFPHAARAGAGGGERDVEPPGPFALFEKRHERAER